MPQGEGTYGSKVGRPKKSGFKMRSGNKPAFKMMGSSPSYSDQIAAKNKYYSDQIAAKNKYYSKQISEKDDYYKRQDGMYLDPTDTNKDKRKKTRSLNKDILHFGLKKAKTWITGNKGERKNIQKEIDLARAKKKRLKGK